jgi:hypothetical protein
MTGPKPEVVERDGQTYWRFYHFTSTVYLTGILSDGITRGDVPLSMQGGFNAVWLTTEPHFDKQKWVRGSVLFKDEVRITVDVPANDIALRRWQAYEPEIDPTWWRVSHHIDADQLDHYWLHRGVVRAQQIVAVDLKPGIEDQAGANFSEDGVVHSFGHSLSSQRFMGPQTESPTLLSLVGGWGVSKNMAPKANPGGFHIGKIRVRDTQGLTEALQREAQDTSGNRAAGVDAEMLEQFNTTEALLRYVLMHRDGVWGEREAANRAAVAAHEQGRLDAEVVSAFKLEAGGLVLVTPLGDPDKRMTFITYSPNP